MIRKSTYKTWQLIDPIQVMNHYMYASSNRNWNTMVKAEIKYQNTLLFFIEYIKMPITMLIHKSQILWCWPSYTSWTFFLYICRKVWNPFLKKKMFLLQKYDKKPCSSRIKYVKMLVSWSSKSFKLIKNPKHYKGWPFFTSWTSILYL